MVRHRSRSRRTNIDTSIVFSLFFSSFMRVPICTPRDPGESYGYECARAQCSNGFDVFALYRRLRAKNGNTIPTFLHDF